MLFPLPNLAQENGPPCQVLFQPTQLSNYLPVRQKLSPSEQSPNTLAFINRMYIFRAGRCRKPVNGWSRRRSERATMLREVPTSMPWLPSPIRLRFATSLLSALGVRCVLLVVVCCFVPSCTRRTRIWHTKRRRRATWSLPLLDFRSSFGLSWRCLRV